MVRSEVQADSHGKALSALLKGKSETEAEIIKRAVDLADESGLRETAAAGSPSVARALAVASILNELRLDHETIAAGVLRDVVEDTPVTLDQVRTQFGSSVAMLVENLARMDALQQYQPDADKGKKDKNQSEALRKMLLAMSEDLRAVLIKLADRVCNLRNLKTFPEDKRELLARESLDIFSPLANRLGIGRLRWELEDLSFHQLDPATYKNIARLLDERRVVREANVVSVVERLRTELRNAGIEGEVSGRPKHIYSIWRKMTRKGVEFDQIFDVTAVRVLARDVAGCYATLGVVHSLWEPISGEFDDYIATPKENGYKALHTAVIGPDGKNLEIQIRTHTMHKEAELGVAAHWSYKEGGKQNPELQKKIGDLRRMIRGADSGEMDFVTRFKAEMFKDRVYVLTPKGEIIELTKGATPLDFAYHVHSQVGHRCRGAKVDGKIVPLTYELKTGEKVEIMTGKQPAPSREWLNPHAGYLKTPRARAKVRQHFRALDYDRYVASGRVILERELQRLGIIGANLEKVSQRFGKPKLEVFLEAIGRGEVTPTQLAAVLSESVPQPAAAPAVETVTTTGTEPAQKDATVGGIRILGVANLLTIAARCCQPVPNDTISGYVTRGRGVTIHRSDCRNFHRLARENPERVIPVDWNARGTDVFKAQVQVVAQNRAGVSRDVTNLFAEAKINVVQVTSVPDSKRGVVTLNITVEVANSAQLGEILGEISQKSYVLQAGRRASG